MGKTIKVPQKPVISKSSLLDIAISILTQKQAREILVFDIRPLSQLFDYAVVSSGLSSTQIDVIRRALERGLRSEGLRPLGVEGKAESGWILLDYNDFVIHVFTPEKREYYRLDLLWGDCPVEEIGEDFKPGEIEKIIMKRNKA